MRVTPLAAIILAAGLLPLAGCTGSISQSYSASGDDSKYDATAVQNTPDRFIFGGAAKHKSGNMSYDWQTSHLRGMVTLGGYVRHGSVSFTVTDFVGRTLYTQRMDGGSITGTQATTDLSLPGTWQVTLEFQDYEGTLGIELVGA